MKSVSAVPLLLLTVLWACAPAPDGGGTGTGQFGSTVTAIINADAHTMTAAGRIGNATILLMGARVAAIGADIHVPDGARIIDARGNTVTPGLIASATHLGLVEVSSSLDTDDRSASSDMLGASFDIRYGLNFNSVLIPVARADGVTHAVIVPGASAQTPFAGTGALISTGAGDDLLVQSDIAMFAGIVGPSSSQSGQSRSSQWTALRLALGQAGRPDRGAGVSGSELEDVLRRADLDALRPVAEGSMPLVLRTQRESDIRQAVALARDFGIRVILYQADEAWRAAELLAEHKIPVILDPMANLPRRFDNIGARLDAAAILHRAGVPLALHAWEFQMSHNAGQELRQAAGVGIANGLPWQAALEALTAGAARIWGIEEHLGSLEAGKSANLVIWSGDPFEMTTRPLTVIVDGQDVSLETRQTLLRDRYMPMITVSDRPEQENSH